MALVAIGCSKGAETAGGGASSGTKAGDSAKIVGKWKVDPEFVKAKENADTKAFLTGFTSTFWYEFKEDKTFKGAMTEGTWSVSGDKLTISTTTMMGQSVEKFNKTKGPVIMTGELSNGGKTLTLHPPTVSMLPESLHAGIQMAKE